MCGILGGITNTDLSAAVCDIIHRGPDGSGSMMIGKVQLYHVRLAIIDLDRRSDQPMTRGRTTVCYNGELWNYLSIRAELADSGCEFTTNGDTEVVAYALDCWGLQALERFEGMFAIAWTTDGMSVMLARDRFGEVPIYYRKAGGEFSFASERRALERFYDAETIRELTPGSTVGSSEGSHEVFWYMKNDDHIIPIQYLTIETAAEIVKRHLTISVRERLIGDVPLCVLLSGGIDSGAIAALAKENRRDIVAYTASFNVKSRDLLRARETAEMLGIELREVLIPMPSREDLAMIVDVIEQPSKAQAEIGWACWHLAKRIRDDGFKIVLSGEGSDELWASYAFSYHALKREDWHEYRRRLFLRQSDKNFARCNKIFMRHGVECRLPFLNTSLVEFAWALPPECVRTMKHPKAVLVDAMRCMLPDSVLAAPKIAFQDGLGIKKEIERMLGDDARTFYRRQHKSKRMENDLFNN